MRFANFFQSLFSWMLATLLVCGGLVAFFLYQRGDEELRTYLEQSIAQTCPELSVNIGSAKFLPGEGIRLRQVSIAESPTNQGQFRADVAFCEEAMIQCDTSLKKIVDRDITVHQIVLRGLTIKAIRRKNGVWNLSQVIPPPQNDQPTPSIRVENATVQILDEIRIDAKPLTIQNVEAEIISSADSKRIHINASGQTAFFHHLQIEGAISAERPGDWHASGAITDLDCQKVLAEPMFFGVLLEGVRSSTNPSNLLRKTQGLAGTAQLQFACAHATGEVRPRFQIQAQAEGRYQSDKLAMPVTQVSIPSLQLLSDGRQESWSIQRATARYGSSHMELSVSGPRLNIESDVLAQFKATNFDITQEIVALFPPKLQRLWTKYRPTGIADIQVQSFRSNGTWRSEANANCKDISVVCARMPYPLTRCQGLVEFRQNVDLKIDVWGAPDRTWKSNPVHITANIQQPGTNFTGDIRVVMQENQWLTIDERVHHAIPKVVSKVLKDMDARGKLTFDSHLYRRSPNQMIQKQTIVRVRDGALRHSQFPYPLQSVSGEVHLANDVCQFKNFSAQNDSCLVSCEGYWKTDAQSISPAPGQPQGPARSELLLDFVANHIPCDQELREALPAGPRQVWRSLRPAGTIDHAKIKLRHQTGMPKPEIGVVVTQLAKANVTDRRSLEIQPVWFPLPMDRVTGVAEFKPDGSFTLKKIQAEHGSIQRIVHLRTSGGGDFREDSSWDIKLDRIVADRVETTPELLAALPQSFGDALRSLKFNGTLFVNARDVKFSGSGNPNSPIEASWTSTINVDNGDFVLDQHPIKNIYGELNVAGYRRNGEVTNWGTAQCDSLICKGIQVTKLQSPWYMDQSKLLFGDINNNREFGTAHVFGGTGQVTGQVAFTDNLDFAFSLALRNFDAQLLSRDLGMPAQFAGRGQADLTLQGNSQGTHTYRGRGNIRLTEANLAKLPSLITLLNNLRLRRRPDVFSDSNIDFRVDGPTAYLDHFDLHGESLTLKGSGWIALDRRLDLQFYPLLGGEVNYLPFMRPLAGRTSKNLYQILVGGTLDNLKWTRKPLPAMNDLLEQPAMANPRRGNIIQLR